MTTIYTVNRIENCDGYDDAIPFVFCYTSIAKAKQACEEDKASYEVDEPDFFEGEYSWKDLDHEYVFLSDVEDENCSDGTCWVITKTELVD